MIVSSDGLTHAHRDRVHPLIKITECWGIAVTWWQHDELEWAPRCAVTCLWCLVKVMTRRRRR